MEKQHAAGGWPRRGYQGDAGEWGLGEGELKAPPQGATKQCWGGGADKPFVAFQETHRGDDHHKRNIGLAIHTMSLNVGEQPPKTCKQQTPVRLL